jgi:hypothetical protein
MNFLLRFLGLEPGNDVRGITGGEWQVSRPMEPVLLWLLVGLGLGLALINFLPRIAMRLRTRIASFFLRLAMLGVLLVVLTNVELEANVVTGEKQQWVVLLDDSGSMATQDVDGAMRFAAARQDLERIRDEAGDGVQVSVQTVSSRPVGEEPGQGPTLLGEALNRTALSRARPDRVIVLTDGRDSEGRDLRTVGEDIKARDVRLAVKVYGDENAPRSTGISAEPERPAIRLGEEIVIRGTLSGKSDGDQTVVLRENGKEVSKQVVSPAARGRFIMRHRPKNKGQHLYAVELTTKDSVSLNKAARFTVQVIQEKINVLLLDGFPRFEFKLMKGVLEVDPLVNLVSVCHIPGGGFHVQGEPLHRNPEQGLISAQADVFKYDVIILRDVPRASFRAGGDTTESRLQHLVQHVVKRGGGLIVCGGQDVYRAGRYENSALAEVLPFDLSNRIAGDDQFEGMFHVSIPKAAYDHPLLQLLPDPAENRERLNSLRQLDGSNNVGQFKPLATPLLTRIVKVKSKGDTQVEKETPIMGYLAVGEGKVLGFAVDTLWRWQLQPEFADPPLTMLLANAVRFLAPPPGRKPGVPDVTLTNPAPQVGQELLLTTDLKDPNYDPIQGADLLVTVRRPDGTSYRMYPRDLPEEPGHYAYRVLLDQPGNYRVTATFGKLESVREIVAGAAAGEFADLSADRKGMARLVQAAGGEIVPETMAVWLQTADRGPARQAATRAIEVWNSWLVLVVFLLLVSVDCYLRKRQGLA